MCFGFGFRDENLGPDLNAAQNEGLYERHSKNSWLSP